MMSWPIDVETVQCMQDVFTRKPYMKIDIITRLQIISALDDGESKMDVAREYGVHPNTIAYIYKQKSTLIKKYKKKLNCIKGFRSLNLGLLLIDWFKTQINLGNVIFQEQMLEKAKEILSSSSQEFDYLDDWLIDFRMRHNIIKYTKNPDCEHNTSEEWLKLTEAYHMDDLYVAGTCALYHKLDYNKYLKGRENESLVSLLMITNSSGSDKQELLVAGDEATVKFNSLPVTYCYQNSENVCLSAIVSYLGRWDKKLNSAKRHVALVMDFPSEFLEQMHFDNIKVIHAEVECLRKFLEKIMVCFKYNYRKHQIIKTSTDQENYTTILPFLHMMSLAWHNVSPVFIHRLFHPPPEGSLHLSDSPDKIDEKHCSLTEWIKTCDLKLESADNSQYDQFMLCDQNLQSIDYQSENKCCVMHSPLPKQDRNQSTSGIEAYQAMKRLISHLQGSGASGSIVQSARALENQLEYQAMAEINDRVSANGTK